MASIPRIDNDNNSETDERTSSLTTKHNSQRCAQLPPILAVLPKLRRPIISAKSQSASPSISPGNTAILATSSRATAGDTSKSAGYQDANSRRTCDLTSVRDTDLPWRKITVPQELHDPLTPRHAFDVSDPARHMSELRLPAQTQNHICTTTTHSYYSQLFENGYRQGH